ncbi:hypothetical protein V2J52_10775 [Georgenia sp. MJ173]|uniref:hypothetical protein n=1 Tax=Georgenia sunbinii TaxID=3117728 RepID=UPI002F261537
MRDGWRLSDLAREAFHNVLGRSARLLPVVLLAVVLGSGYVAFLAVETSSMRAELDDLAQQGRGVVSYLSGGDAPALITRASCERLADQPGVLAAGAIIPTANQSGIPIGADVITQRASSTLFPQLSETDVLVGSGLLDRPPSAHSRVIIGGEVLDALPAAPQREGMSSAHALTVPLRPDDAQVERCTVVLDPLVTLEDVARTHVGTLHITGGQVTGGEMLRATHDPVQTFLDRPSRFLPVLLGVLGAVATSITYRLRASELAVYRLSGTSSRSLLALIALESLLVTGIAATSATLAGIALHEHVLAPATPALWGAVLAGTWATVTLIATADLALRRPTELAKDR